MLLRKEIIITNTFSKHSKMHAYIIIISILCCLLFGNAFEERKLNIGILVPYDSVDGGCTRHAIEMGFKDVNSIRNLITHEKNYTFKLQPYFGKTDQTDGTAIEAQYQLYKNGPLKIGFLGPPYKDQTNYVTEYSTAQANIHISYTDSNEPLKAYFVFRSQTPPSITASFRAARALCEKYNWYKISIVYDYSDPRYRKNADSLQEVLMEESVPANNKTFTILTDQGIWSKPTRYRVSSELGVLQERGSRIIFALLSVNGARKVFCEAYNRKMFKPKVIWILFEVLPKDWASDKYNAETTEKGKAREISCTEEQLLMASDRYIAVTKQGLRRDNKQTVSNMTKTDYVQRLQSLVGPNVECEENVAYAYDAVWVLAFGLSRISMLKDLTKYRYHDFSFVLQITSERFGINFEGLTGPLAYNRATGNKRIGQLSVWSNKVKSDKTYVGTHDTFAHNLSLVPNANLLLFKNSVVPKDTATYVTSFANFSMPLLVTMWFVAFIGIVIALLILLINVIFMCDNHAALISPISNCIIILGSVLCYFSVIIYGIDTRFVSKEDSPYICYAFVWSLSIGFTLTFGSLFAKAWQLYKLYMTPEVKVENTQIEIKEVPEWFLSIIVFVFLLIDVIIISTWMKASPFTHEIHNLTKSDNLFEDTINIEQISGCSCTYKTEFTIGIYCYKGVMLIFGFFLAWQTRNAKIITQNDSKQIAMAIYNVVAVSLIGVVCVTVLANTTRHEALYAIVAVCICICTTTTLLLVFIPKIREISYSDSASISNNKKNDPTNKMKSTSSKYTLAYMRKTIKKEPEMKPGSSTTTLTTQVSEQQNQNGDSPLGTPNGSSVVSMSPTYLSSHTFMSPPEYEFKDDGKRNIDFNGRLSSGIYVGTISEEAEELPPSEETKIDGNKVVV